MSRNDFAALAIVLFVNVLAFRYMIFRGPKRRRCKCGAKMDAGEPSRNDVIVGGRPVSEITTLHTCPKCGLVHKSIRIKKLSQPMLTSLSRPV